MSGREMCTRSCETPRRDSIVPEKSSPRPSLDQQVMRTGTANKRILADVFGVYDNLSERREGNVRPEPAYFALASRDPNMEPKGNSTTRSLLLELSSSRAFISRPSLSLFPSSTWCLLLLAVCKGTFWFLTLRSWRNVSQVQLKTCLRWSSKRIEIVVMDWKSQ